jgi:hypothetical protein
MKKNIGAIDRGIRVVLGIVILAAGYRAHAWWGWLGLLPLLTATISWCPVYLPFRINTGAKDTSARTGG